MPLDHEKASDPAVIREDFDRIARTPDTGWNHNNHYHRYLLRHILRRMEKALDIGCGKGDFARELARRAASVEAVDLSPEMIAEAVKLSDEDNIEYKIADIRETALPPGQYDCISSIATFHHLPMEETLVRIKEALAPGGVLAVLDLYDGHTPLGILLSAVAFLANLLYRLLKTGRIREPHPEEWRTHSAHDVLLRLRGIRRICAKILPGSRVRRHLFWRYSIIWKNPACTAE